MDTFPALSGRRCWSFAVSLPVPLPLRHANVRRASKVSRNLLDVRTYRKKLMQWLETINRREKVYTISATWALLNAGILRMIRVASTLLGVVQTRYATDTARTVLAILLAVWLRLAVLDSAAAESGRNSLTAMAILAQNR